MPQDMAPALLANHLHAQNEMIFKSKKRAAWLTESTMARRGADGAPAFVARHADIATNVHVLSQVMMKRKVLMMMMLTVFRNFV